MKTFTSYFQGCKQEKENREDQGSATGESCYYYTDRKPFQPRPATTQRSVPLFLGRGDGGPSPLFSRPSPSWPDPSLLLPCRAAALKWVQCHFLKQRRLWRGEKAGSKPERKRRAARLQGATRKQLTVDILDEAGRARHVIHFSPGRSGSSAARIGPGRSGTCSWPLPARSGSTSSGGAGRQKRTRARRRVGAHGSSQEGVWRRRPRPLNRRPGKGGGVGSGRARLAGAQSKTGSERHLGCARRSSRTWTIRFGSAASDPRSLRFTSS